MQSQKETHLPTIIFQGLWLNFGGVTTNNVTNQPTKQHTILICHRHIVHLQRLTFGVVSKVQVKNAPEIQQFLGP